MTILAAAVLGTMCGFFLGVLVMAMVQVNRP